jgi:hypothetical protein
MLTPDELKIYLPKYLSPGAENDLFEGLKQFSLAATGKLYTRKLRETSIVYQGDGLSDILVFNLPETRSVKARALIVSNTCDIDSENVRMFDSRVCYTPIFKLAPYEAALRKRGEFKKDQIDGHVADIRRQRITQIFHLPQENELDAESFVFLDRLISMPSNSIPPDFRTSRLFTLSDFGCYLFLFKLSLHFTRINDKVERGSS